MNLQERETRAADLRQRGGRSATWRAVVALALLATWQDALAGNLLRRTSTATPAELDAARAALQSAATAQEATRQVQGSLLRAREAIKAFQAAQEAARALLAGQPGGVPNGLGVGGLQVAPGAELDPSLWQGAALPTQEQASGRTEVTVTQTAAQAILTWETFNVGQETDLHFDQTAGGSAARDWVALNLVLDPSGRPSQILGSIRAEGQVYLLNRNGILFGGTSQVNVGALVASGLDFDPWSGSILATPTPTVFRAPAGQVGGTIEVEAGARLQMGAFGQAVLLGGEVDNAGAIEAADGQVILAAGTSASLAPGFANRRYALTLSGPGRVRNSGLVSTPRGNITLAGADVRQGGLLTATTGAEANGSIDVGSEGFLTTFAPGSVTQVLPDEGGKPVVGAGTYVPSQVGVYGQDIRLEGGSTVYVPGGVVQVGVSPRLADANTPDDVRVFLADGALVDVGGLRDVEVAMEQNTIQGELRASELADNPVLRDGPLRGDTVYFDARRGAGPIADLAGYYDLVERDVAQLMTGGGSVTLAGREIILQEGSVIDLSGGSVQYLDGYVRSSQLLTESGALVRIEDAAEGERYLGLAGDSVVDHARWGLQDTFRSRLSRVAPRFEHGYLEGRAAGTLRLDTNSREQGGAGGALPAAEASPTGEFRLLEGTVLADVVVGPSQRELAGSTDAALGERTRGRAAEWQERPRGATLDFLRSGHVTIADVAPRLQAGYQPGDPLDPGLRFQHVLPARWFDGTAFTQVAISAGFTLSYDGDAASQAAPGGTLLIPAGVTVALGDGGSFSYSGRQVDVEGAIVAPGGSVTLSALDGACAPGLCAEAPPEHVRRIRLGAGGVIDVAGRWTNDVLADGPRRPLNGGTVRLDALELVLEEGSLVDASSGARLEAGGSKVTGGKGGSITLDVTRPLRLGEGPSLGGTLVLDGTLAAYGMKGGGSLTLVTASDIVIGEALPPGAPGTSLLLTPEFFTRGGFASYTVNGGRSLTVADGTWLEPTTELFLLPERPAELPGGLRLLQLAERQLLPEGQRAPMKLSLSSLPAGRLEGDAGATFAVTLGDGATIQLAPGSTVALSGNAAVDVRGTIRAPGGDIRLTTTERSWSGSLGGPFVGESRITVHDGAALLAPGYTREIVEGALVRHAVEGGGDITILAAGSGRPDRLAGDVEIQPGALLDVSGRSDLATLLGTATSDGSPSPYLERWIEGGAGAVSISSRYGGAVAGELRLGPGGESALGGSLIVEVAPGSSLVVADEATPEARALVLDAQVLDASRADELALTAQLITFDGGVSLEARRALTLTAPVLGTRVDGGAVTLAAPYVRLGGGGLTGLPAATGAPPTSTLTVQADLIDLTGTLDLGCLAAGCAGFGLTTLEATGDIRLSAGAQPYVQGSVAAGLLSPGSIVFSASQVYVTTRTRSGQMERVAADPGYLVLARDRIEVRRPAGAGGEPPPVPLSFGERLTLRAPTIVQGGVLRAPQGQLRLEGVGTTPAGAPALVTLLPGSLTSSSLEGLTVLYGDIERSGFLGYSVPGVAPAKEVLLDAPVVDVQAGAVIDVAGGGDLLGYAFQQGNGGSFDVLAAPGAYAILPGLVGSGPAPRDAGLADPSLKVGDAVYLQGVPGLPDGVYTLLPAHYALLPGGLLVRQLPSIKNAYGAAPAATWVAADGTVVAAGYRGVAGTSIRDPGWSRFEVLDRATFGAYSDLVTTSFNAFARGLAQESGVGVRTPADAGSAVLAASQRLELLGTGRFGAADGLLGNLDVSASRIAVGLTLDGYLTLDPEALEAFGAGSVLLGGRRSADPAGQGTRVAVSATDVVVGTSAPWTAPEIILAATDRVEILEGSELRAEGPVAGDASALLLTGNGALLRLSTGERVGIVRTGTGAGGAGVLTVGAATLAGPGSLTLDGSASLDLAAGVELQVEQLDLASSRVILGDAPAGVAGTRLDAALLAALGGSADLLLRGHEAILLYRKADGTPLAIGGLDGAGARTLDRLTLDTGLLVGGDQAGPVAEVVATELTLQNSGGAVTGLAGVGELRLDVGRLVLGPGQVRLAALGGTAGVVEARGTGALAVSGGLSLETGGLTAWSGVSYGVLAGGILQLTSPGPGAAGPPAGSRGGRLELTGASVLLDTQVALTAGTFQATATGGAVTLGASARVDARGAEQPFGASSRFAPGGAIVLSATGDVTVAAGAVLDVSGSAAGGDAGRIEVVAGGTASLEGTLRADRKEGAGLSFRGGAFRLDAGTVADFTALNRALEAGGFDDARALRLRTDARGLVLAVGETLTAHRVELRADAGSVVVRGTIDASGDAARPGGGRVELVGAGGVTVAGTIDASAGPAPDGGFEPASGKVELVATGGSLSVAQGALIDVSGGRQGGGEVVLRALRRPGNDLAVDALAGEVRGARAQLLQGLERYDGVATLDAALAERLSSDAAAWLSGSPTQAGAPAVVRARLGSAAASWQVAPAMLVTSPGDLAVTAALDLHGLASPGHLGLQAAGRLDFLAGSVVSDGFEGVSRSAALLAGPSFSYGFESGGDLALLADALVPGAMIRTGSGDVSLRAGGDLVLQGASAVVYTAGRSTATAAGFAPPLKADGVTPMPLGQFPTEGGDLDLWAARDVRAALPSQPTSAWLFRYGSPATPAAPGTQTSWSVVHGNFEQGVAALGGGDVRVHAGRDVVQLDVAIPTTGHLAVAMDQLGAAADQPVLDHAALPGLVVRGGGDLELEAGRDVRGGLFLLGRGHAELRAGGGILASEELVELRNAKSSPALRSRRAVGVLLGLMDATASLTAASRVEIQAAFDPMRQGQILDNLDAGTGSSWWGYTERTALEATAVAGDVRYWNDPWASVDPSLAGPAPYRVSMSEGGRLNTLSDAFRRAPPTLRLTSLGGSIPLAPRFTERVGLLLEPAARGTIELLARTDVRIGIDVAMEEMAPEFRHGPLAPFEVVNGVASLPEVASLRDNNLLRGFTPIHLGDPAPARFYAVDGAVCAYLGGGCVKSRVGNTLQAIIALPKPIEVLAGTDVVAGDYQPQHDDPTDLSWLRAGRDLRDVALQVIGPGAVLLEAGRDIVFSLPVVSPTVTSAVGGLAYAKGSNLRPSATASRPNAALPSGEAASLYLLAGTGAGVDYRGFAEAYLDPSNGQEVVRTYLPELATYMTGLGQGGLTGAELVAAFDALPEVRRALFLQRVYFNELRETGVDYNDADGPRYQSYARGFQAVALLFPGDPAALPAGGAGSILLNGKPVEAEAAADLTLLAPYGRVLVGSVVLDTSDKASGVVTRRGGDVRIMADRNVDLETSRVFTLQGGDITMWTSNGSITAGTGSKTSVFQVPLSYLMSANGVVTLNAFGISTGAGIGVLDALQDAEERRRSRLDLIAPRGEVDAGDAGIRVVGDLNIAALVVVGVENIQVTGGTSAGVPEVSVPSVAALTTADQVSKVAAQEGLGPNPAAAQRTLAELPSIITVEVVGYETTDPDPADGEQQKRKARPAGR